MVLSGSLTTWTTISWPGLISSAMLRPRPRPRLGAALPSGSDDLVDVQEAVSLQADVDEGRLHSGQHVVDLALVDVADDRAAAAALDVELRDLPVVAGGGLLAAALAPCGGSFCLEHGDPGLAPVDADEDVLLHVFPFRAAPRARTQPPRRRRRRGGCGMWDVCGLSVAQRNSGVGALLSRACELRLDVNALQEPDRHEGDQHRGSSVAHQRQGDPGDGHDSQVHADVDEDLEHQHGGDAARDQGPVQVLRKRQ